MGFIATTAEATVARHALSRRDTESVEKSISSRAEQMQKALDLAAEDFGGDIPDELSVEIFQDPTLYEKSSGTPDQENCDICKAGEDTDHQKEHLGWDKMVSKLMGEGKSKEQAERIAGAINRNKNG